MRLLYHIAIAKQASAILIKHGIILPMQIEKDSISIKIFLSFLLSIAYLIFGFILRFDYPSIAMAMNIFGFAGIIASFTYMVVNLTTWSENIQDKVKSFFFFWFEIANTLIVITAIAFAIRFFVVQPFVVRGNSMEPNYHNGEIMVVNEISYRLGQDPKRGEVIIFRYPKNPEEKYIKRIIGLPGETIKIEDGKMFIKEDENSPEKTVEEDYIPYEDQVDLNTNQQWDLSENEYFVMGDNRLPTGSSDSRHWGPLPEKNIIGKVWIIIWPLNDLGFFNRPEYSL